MGALLAAGLAAGGQVLGGLFQGGAAKRAGDAQAKAMERGIDLQRDMWERSLRQGRPWYDSGVNALSALNYEMGLGPMPQRRDMSIRSVQQGGARPRNAFHGGGFQGGQVIPGRDNRSSLIQLGRDDYMAQQARMRQGGASAYGGMPVQRQQNGGRTVYKVGGQTFDSMDEAQDYASQNQGFDYTPFESREWQDDELYREKPAGYHKVGWRESPLNYGYKQGSFEEDPGYQFRQDEATKALERSGNAAGIRSSGAYADALNRQVQGLASQEYNNWFNRDLAAAQQEAANFGQYWGLELAREDQANRNRAAYDNAFLNFTGRETDRRNTYLDRLGGLAGMGQSANSQMAGINQNYATATSSLFGGIGDARANQAVNRSNAFTGMLTGLGQTYAAYDSGFFNPMNSTALTQPQQFAQTPALGSQFGSPGAFNFNLY